MDEDQETQQGRARPAREPIFTAPWPAVVLAAVILGSYAWQVLAGGGDAAAQRLGFRPSDLTEGRWWTVLSVTVVHGGWIHAGMNAVGALAFAPPVARRLGLDGKGALLLLGLYLASAALSTLGYAALHPHDPTYVIGASGAVSGLMGAASRLMSGRSEPAPLFDRQVVSMAGGWLIANLLLGLTGLAPGAEGARIAWEAHVAGYAAGALLVGPLVRLAPRKDEEEEDWIAPM